MSEKPSKTQGFYSPFMVRAKERSLLNQLLGIFVRGIFTMAPIYYNSCFLNNAEFMVSDEIGWMKYFLDIFLIKNNIQKINLKNRKFMNLIEDSCCDLLCIEDGLVSQASETKL